MKNILCFGDSNTWGYNPYTKDRFSREIRWTGKLQDKLKNDANIIEQGLCGRTTIYEDISRPGRKGIDSLHKIFQQYSNIDFVILMLGTNDCKKYYNNSAREIASGVEKCLNIILERVNPKSVLLISPITLGKDVWRKEYDPDFNEESVNISKELKNEYKNIAVKKNVNFLAASEFANPSDADHEHLDELGHKNLAEAIFQKLEV